MFVYECILLYDDTKREIYAFLVSLFFMSPFTIVGLFSIEKEKLTKNFCFGAI